MAETNDSARKFEEAHAATPPADGYVGDPAVQAEGDGRYTDREKMWSGQPNGALVAEVAGLSPWRVLDVGCGEGADAVWLATAGWDVTAPEVSGVALERAAAQASRPSRHMTAASTRPTTSGLRWSPRYLTTTGR
jgi:2-polyprenyl-3-methyl-5-hydroxy-6-metoxy-1,4-benzoquinol methylase